MERAQKHRGYLVLKYSGCNDVSTPRTRVQEEKGERLLGATSLRKELPVQYHVTYHLGSDEFTDEVDAPDAATAVSKIQFDHGRTEEHFELISVQLIEDNDPEVGENVSSDET